MQFPKGIVKLDVKLLQLAESVEVASSFLRAEGKEEDAIALFRLRTKIREGLAYDEAKKIYDHHIKNLSERMP